MLQVTAEGSEIFKLSTPFHFQKVTLKLSCMLEKNLKILSSHCDFSNPYTLTPYTLRPQCLWYIALKPHYFCFKTTNKLKVI